LQRLSGATSGRAVEHDRHFHPDVIGLRTLDQLRHYVLHLAKLVGVFAEAADLDASARGACPTAGCSPSSYGP
jgi:hypothetical protein